MAKNNKSKGTKGKSRVTPTAAAGGPNAGPGVVPTILLSVISAVLMALAFHPADIPAPAWIGMAPLLIVIARKRPLAAALWSMLAGYVFFFIGVNWISTVSMIGLLAICIPLAAYFGIFGFVTSLSVRRLGVPLMLAAPVVWVACEYLRGFALTGFPWLFLAHSQYALLPLIQVSDITGAYGISFLIVLVNAFAAELAMRLFAKQRFRKFDASGLMPRAACVVAALAVVLGYGFWRLNDVRGGMSEGPRLLIVQPNIEQILKERRSTAQTISGDIEDQTRGAMSAYKLKGDRPDMIVWPETMIQPGPESRFAGEKTRRLPELVALYNVYLCAGGTHVKDAPNVYEYWDPDAEKFVKETGDFTDLHNSAYVYSPAGEMMGRYDKIHLVPFGEFVPMKNILPFMSDIILKSAGFVRDIEAGDKVVFFEMRDAKGKAYTFSTPICYEVGFPDLFTSFVEQGGGKKADFVVNISNDGWFQTSAELEQTTAIAAFRAVENRVGVVRSTNTGISAVIRPDGYFSWRDDVLHNSSGGMKAVQGELMRNVWVSDKSSIYSRVKDVFAILMVVLSALGLAGSIVIPLFRKPAEAAR
jgi:apolipoprotein N-acyltransferase